jgi:hypothetical protein
MAMPVEAVFGFEPLVGQLEARAAPRLEQLDGDHGFVAALAVGLPAQVKTRRAGGVISR